MAIQVEVRVSLFFLCFLFLILSPLTQAKSYDLSLFKSDFWKKREKLLLKKYLASDYLLRKKEQEIQKDAQIFIRAYLIYAKLEEKKLREVEAYALKQLEDLPLDFYLKNKAHKLLQKKD